MLHLRKLGLLDLTALTAAGQPLEAMLDWWQTSDRRHRMRQILIDRDGVNPDEVIFSPSAARQRGLARTLCFPRGNLAPQGSVIKSTAIDPSVVDPDGVFRMTGPARVFTTERAAIAAIKQKAIQSGDIMVLICRGPAGAGMEEVYQVTSALKHLEFGKHVAVITDARFSGVSSGACIGHVGPEALAGGPVGKLLEGDTIQIVIDQNSLNASVDLVGAGDQTFDPDVGARILASRSPRPDLFPDPQLPSDTRLWAALQTASGGVWGGCVYDAESIIEKLAPR
jgi:dihydroxyacid dehydratase/phosphogluconate dehydratase